MKQKHNIRISEKTNTQLDELGKLQGIDKHDALEFLVNEAYARLIPQEAPKSAKARKKTPNEKDSTETL